VNKIDRNQIIVFLFLVFFFFSCEKSIYTIEEYYDYINDPKNGLVKMKEIGTIEFSMKYLPSNFYVYKTIKDTPKLSIDSLEKEYSSSLNFILKIAPSKESKVKFDVMTETVNSLEEFQKQSLAVNFELQNFIYLKIGKNKIKPVLVETENVYGLAKHRLINIIFAKDEFEESWQNEDKIDLVFNDEIYNTGKHHFLFQKKDINKIPQLEYK
jgi:hypothetical protein